MRTEIAIDVASTPREVYELARDIGRWPALLPHYRTVTIRSRDRDVVVATMRATRQLAGRIGLPVAWRARQWADDSDPDDLRLRFQHVAGATRGMDVTWHIRPTARGARVSIEHDFSRRLPVLGDRLFPLLVDRLFVRPIAGRTLATFKSLAERDAG